MSLDPSEILEEEEIMVWRGFSYDDKLPTCWTTTEINSSSYCQLLEDVLVLYLVATMYKPVVFQQNNPSSHVSQRTKAWFSENDIAELD